MRIKDFMDQGGGPSGCKTEGELIKRVPGSGFETSGHARPTSIRTLAPKLLAPMPRGARAPGEPANPRRSLAGAKAGAGTAVELWRLAEALRRVLEAPLSANRGTPSTRGGQLVGGGVYVSLAPGAGTRGAMWYTLSRSYAILRAV